MRILPNDRPMAMIEHKSESQLMGDLPKQRLTPQTALILLYILWLLWSLLGESRKEQDDKTLRSDIHVIHLSPCIILM